MGAAQSKVESTNDIVNRAVTNVLMASSSQCASTTSVVQEISFTDLTFTGCQVSFNNISQDAQLNTNVSCAQDSSNATDLSNTFQNELDQQLKATLSGIPGAILTNSQVQTMNSIKNDIINNININSIANCVSNTIVQQKQTYGRIDVDCRFNSPSERFVDFSNISQRLLLSHVSKCTQSNTQLAKATAEMDTLIKTVAESSNKGFFNFDMTTYLFSIGSSFLLCIFLLVVSSMIGYATQNVSPETRNQFFDTINSPQNQQWLAEMTRARSSGYA